MNRQDISERTGFDAGVKFESEQQVREYFNHEILASLVDVPESDIPPQSELDQMADAVIENKWHCDF